MSLHTMEATPESDERLRKEYYHRGMKDRMNGEKPQLESSNGMIYKWYMEGYNSIMAE